MNFYKKLGEIRPNQLITTYGPGSIMDAVNDSLTVLDIEYWDTNNIGKEIRDARLASYMNVRRFFMPKTGGKEDIPVVSFPYYHVCSKGTCKFLFDMRDYFDMDQYKKNQGEVKCPKCGFPAYPSRFITVCEDGHMDDFPWRWWVHHGETSCKEDMYLKSMGNDVMMSKIKHHLCTYDAIGEPEEPLSETMDIKITGAKTGLFPVWLLSYKNGKRIAYAAVNGSTGKVAADIPLDIGKFLLGCLIGVAPLYFLLNLFLTVRPGVLLAFVSAIGALVTMIYCDEMEKIADVETHENDLGFFARHTLNAKKSGGRKKKLQTKKLQTKKPQKNIKRKLKNKITSFVKFSCFIEVIQLIAFMIVLLCLKFDINPFLFNWDIMGKASYVVACISCLVAIYGAVKGIVNVRRVKRKSGVMGLFIAFATILSVAVVLIKPVMDKYYYGCVLLVCAATILTLIDLVISHNRMSTRPLPQFEYKGGDHRA